MKAIYSFIIMLICIQPAHAENFDTKKSQEMAIKLAECGGVFSAMSQIMNEMGKKNASITFAETARGAYFAGAFSNHVSGNIPVWKNAISWAENIKETEKTYWLGLLELYTPTKDKVFPDEFMQAMDFCTSLNPVQTKLVNMMREVIYSEKAKKLPDSK